MPSIAQNGSRNTTQSRKQKPVLKFSNQPRSAADVIARREIIKRQRESLPIASVKERLVQEVKNHDILIIVGETGSGKTTLASVSI
uniref:RNA helicase n=1 Tax=Salix viminalis TaxID=40686 RepID=A0A6N2LQQ6_SALVM